VKGVCARIKRAIEVYRTANTSDNEEVLIALEWNECGLTRRPGLVFT